MPKELIPYMHVRQGHGLEGRYLLVCTMTRVHPTQCMMLHSDNGTENLDFNDTLNDHCGTQSVQDEGGEGVNEFFCLLRTARV